VGIFILLKFFKLLIANKPLAPNPFSNGVIPIEQNRVDPLARARGWPPRYAQKGLIGSDSKFSDSFFAGRSLGSIEANLVYAIEDKDDQKNERTCFD